MKTSETLEFDHLIVGSGLAGLSSALALAASGRRVAVITKRSSIFAPILVLATHHLHLMARPTTPAYVFGCLRLFRHVERYKVFF